MPVASNSVTYTYRPTNRSGVLQATEHGVGKVRAQDGAGANHVLVVAQPVTARARPVCEAWGWNIVQSIPLFRTSASISVRSLYTPLKTARTRGLATNL